MSDETTERDVEAEAGSALIRDLTHAVMRHYGYTPPDLAAAERVHPGRGCDDQCVNEDGESVHPVYDELQNTASLMVDVVEPIVAERIAQARREGAAALEAVHARYFDLDGVPGDDDTTPAPEDVWRYDRDFRRALRGDA